LVATVVFVGIGVTTAVSGRAALAVIGAVLAVAAAVPLFLSAAPGALASAPVAVLGVALVANGRAANLAWFGVCVIGGWCALRAGTAVAVGFVVASGMLFGAEWVLAVHDPGWGAWTAGTGFTVLAASLVRHQVVLVERLRALQADLAQRERAEERARIARELHDVIAHSLTVSLLHVSSARLAVQHDPAEAAKALADAERLTRQSLDEVRVTVGMLRSPSDSGIALPTPGIGDLARLVSDLQAAQADVSLTVDGDVTALPSTTGATVYRIVQEALTNASRHAPGARVTVSVAVHGDSVDVCVDSSGPAGQGTGMGVRNMQERAEAVGGTCTAGPGGHGWVVTALLPTGMRSNGRPS
jgi:signal transduction histidine kinase